MTTTGLEVRLREGREKAAVHRFTKTLDDVVLSLREIDHLYIRRGSRPMWIIESLRHEDQDAVIRLEPRSSSRTRDLADMQRPIDALLEGVKSLDQQPEIPKLYSPETVERIKRIATPGAGYSQISFSSYNGRVNSTAILTPGVRENADLAVKGKDVTHGALAGVLDTVGAGRRRNILRVRIFDSQTERAVTGSAVPNLAETLREHWNHKVLVGGQITRNAHGQPIRIEIAEIERLPEDDRGMPDPRELLGIAPDWLDGIAVDDYMRGTRGA
jgi:hypothetical protein